MPRARPRRALRAGRRACPRSCFEVTSTAHAAVPLATAIAQVMPLADRGRPTCERESLSPVTAAAPPRNTVIWPLASSMARGASVLSATLRISTSRAVAQIVGGRAGGFGRGDLACCSLAMLASETCSPRSPRPWRRASCESLAGRGWRRRSRKSSRRDRCARASTVAIGRAALLPSAEESVVSDEKNALSLSDRCRPRRAPRCSRWSARAEAARVGGAGLARFGCTRGLRGELRGVPCERDDVDAARQSPCLAAAWPAPWCAWRSRACSRWRRSASVVSSEACWAIRPSRATLSIPLRPAMSAAHRDAHATGGLGSFGRGRGPARLGRSPARRRGALRFDVSARCRVQS